MQSQCVKCTVSCVVLLTEKLYTIILIYTIVIANTAYMPVSEICIHIIRMKYRQRVKCQGRGSGEPHSDPLVQGGANIYVTQPHAVYD